MDKISPATAEVQNTSCWEDSSPRSEGLKIDSITTCATRNGPQSYTVQTSRGEGRGVGLFAQPGNLATQQCDDMGELEWGGAEGRDELQQRRLRRMEKTTCRAKLFVTSSPRPPQSVPGWTSKTVAYRSHWKEQTCGVDSTPWERR